MSFLSLHTIASANTLPLLILAAMANTTTVSESLLRQTIVEIALSQTKSIDPRWHPDQRDCAGFIRYTYSSAFRQFQPSRVQQGLWFNTQGKKTAFADAQTLIQKNFFLLGRDKETQAQLQSADLLAFQQHHPDGPVFHLMMILRPKDPAHGPIHVIYHPGEPGAAVRIGLLDDLLNSSAKEWYPLSSNNRFLGFFRYKEWSP